MNRMMNVIPMLVRASTQGHDKDRLTAQMADGFALILPRLKRKPYLSPRLLQLSQQPALLKPMEADDLLTAIAVTIDKKDVELSHELLALTLIVARLGGIAASIKIGLLAIDELRAHRASTEASMGR